MGLKYHGIIEFVILFHLNANIISVCMVVNAFTKCGFMTFIFPYSFVQKHIKTTSQSFYLFYRKPF